MIEPQGMQIPSWDFISTQNVMRHIDFFKAPNLGLICDLWAAANGA